MFCTPNELWISWSAPRRRPLSTARFGGVERGKQRRTKRGKHCQKWSGYTEPCGEFGGMPVRVGAESQLGRHYEWKQNRVVMGTMQNVLCCGAEKRFQPVVPVPAVLQSELSPFSAFAYLLNVHVGQHRSPGGATLRLLLRITKRLNLLPALFLSVDGGTWRSYKSLLRGRASDLRAMTLAHWVPGRSGSVQADNEKGHIRERGVCERVAACWHKGGSSTARRAFLAEERTPATEETFDMVQSKSGKEDVGDDGRGRGSNKPDRAVFV